MDREVEFYVSLWRVERMRAYDSRGKLVGHFSGDRVDELEENALGAIKDYMKNDEEE